jgi:hypothetical protein
VPAAPALTGIAKAQSAKAEAVLDKRLRFRDRSVTMRQMLDTLLAEGGKVQVRFSAPKLTRTQFNRMDGSQHDAWTQKVLEKGLAPEYEIVTPDGIIRTLNKTEFDYADSGAPLRIAYDFGHLSLRLHDRATRVTREKYPAIFAREATGTATAPAPVKVAPAERYTYDVAQSRVSYPWIIEVFGADAFEPFNLIELSNYLEGRTETFEGEVSDGWWMDGLRSLGAVDATGKVDFAKIRAAYLAPAPPVPAERFTYAATIRPITHAFLFDAGRLYDPKYPYLDEIPARYGERAQRHGIATVNQRLPLDFQKHMDLRLITADGPPSIQREVEGFIADRADALAKEFVEAFPGREYDPGFITSEITRRIRDEVSEKYGATDAVELVPEAAQRAIQSVAPAPAPVTFSDPGLQAAFGHLKPEPLPEQPEDYIIKQASSSGTPVYSMRAGGKVYADTTPDLAQAIAVAERWGVQTATYYDTALSDFRPLVRPPAAAVEQHQTDPEPPMGAYGEYLASLSDKERDKARKVLEQDYAMRETRNAAPIRGSRHSIVEQLLDRQRSMPYRPLEKGAIIEGESGPLLLNFYGRFKVKPEEHAYALWLYPRLIEAEKAAKNRVDKPAAAPIHYAAIIEGEANRIFALYAQVAP